MVLGPTPDRVVERFTRCVGRVDLPPRWALGHHHGRFGYDTAERICAVAEEFRTRRIPCDAIHIDIDNMDGYRVFTWDNTRFADPPQLIEDLRGLGLRTLVFVDPGVKKETHYHVYDEGVARDAFVRRPDGELFSAYVWPGECVYPDFARQDVREWWTRLHEPLCAAS